MIGLGSNRLTVCRRGGMSVTQAGRGGMEWLAGGRVPSWASPYSAAATVALKAQFSLEQWATIRDYGFAHPALVPFINEDYQVIASLMDLGVTPRHITLDGNSWFDTGVAFNSCTEVYSQVELIRTNMGTFGSTSGSYSGLLQWTSTLYVNNISAGAYSAGWADIVMTPTWLTYNGSQRNYNTSFSSANLILGKTNNVQNSKNSFRTFGFITNGVDHLWVPCYSNGVAGMLDATTAQFKTHEGTGTPTISELIETPAS